MIRLEEFNTIIGKQAWECYSIWLFTAKYFRPSPETFLTSSSYTHFMKFAKFAKRVQLADVKKYISIMVKRNIPPAMWRYAEAHSIYLDNLDRLSSPLDMVDISVDTLFDLAEEYDIEVADIFSTVSPNEIILLIKRRKLSPWLLLKSPKFLHLYATGTSNEERLILETVIKFDFWYEKFSKHKKEAEVIKTIVAELNL